MTAEHIATANLKATPRRGAIRIWLEGPKLLAAGFNAATVKYRHELTDEGVLILTIDENGTNKVTMAAPRKPGQLRPIVDMTCRACTEHFTGGRLDVIYGVDGELGVIRITDATNGN